MSWNLKSFLSSPRARFRSLPKPRPMSILSYRDAIERLNSLQSNAATLEAVRASGGRLSEFAIPEMLEYLERIGYQPHDLNKLNVIHITGTKGKGSTSAFTESILRHTHPAWKIGLYTSPHLVAVRERIRVNGLPISEDEFAQYFFDVWDRLIKNKKPGAPTTPPMPAYFRFMTLMAFHVFLEKQVDATILEVGVGGTYDSTNIVPQPVVTGITALGIDHVHVLGKTLEEIAWQKGGIFKPSVSALTVEQPINAMTVLESRAVELKATDFTIVPENPELSDINLGLAGGHQVQNASLAVALARKFLSVRTNDSLEQELPDAFERGLINTKWPGRCQVVPDPNRPDFTWYLDGAHTTESLECCLKWFVSPGVGIPSKLDQPSRATRAFVFNCTSGRSGNSFLKTVRETIQLRQTLFGYDSEKEFFDHVIFCTNVTYADGHFKGDLTTKSISDSDLSELATQRALASAWTSLVPSFPQNHIHVLPSVEHAVRTLETLQLGTNLPLRILVTGSLHLIGGVIEAGGLSDAALNFIGTR